jgi:hypothetical protein
MAQTEIIEIKANVNSAIADIEKLKDSIEDTQVATQETNETIQKGTDVVDKFTGGAISGFKNLLKTVKTAIKSFGVLRLAVAATGLGALVLLVTSIQQAFTRSEEGQNKYAKLLGQISAVTGELLDRLANLGTAIIDAFTNPRKALEDFGKSIKQFFLDRIKLAAEGLGLLGSAIKKVFEGDFKGAAVDAGKGFVQLNRGINPTVIVTEQLVKATGKLVKVTKEATKAALEEAKVAGQIADLRAEAVKVERDLLVERAEADRDRAALLEKAVNREKFTTQERIAFLEEAGRLEEEITNKEIAAVKLRLEAQKAENALGLSKTEDLNAQAQLEAQLIQLETARLTKQKEVTSQTIALKAEEAAAKKAIDDQEAADEKERADKKLEARKQEIEEEKRIEAERVAAKAQALDAIIGLAGQESALGKAALVAKQLLAAQEFLVDLGVLKNKATTTAAEAQLDGAKAGQNAATGLSETLKLGFPKAIPFLILYAAQAVSIVKGVMSAVKKTKAVAASVGGRSSGSSSSSLPAVSAAQAPAFNIVGSSETNQLAETIAGQQQQPVKAFVVANDVTTAQSLERNTIQGASI